MLEKFEVLVPNSKLSFRNSFNLDCLAPYKGPIIPAIAIGGFLRKDTFEYDSSDYIQATGLVLTFLVRNSLDEKDLVPIKKWEQRCVKVKRIKSNGAEKIIINA